MARGPGTSWSWWGLLPLLDHVVGADEVSRPKPAPDIVLRALELLDTDPADALMVGDAPADLASARAAGVVAVAALWDESDPGTLRAAGPDVARKVRYAALRVEQPTLDDAFVSLTGRATRTTTPPTTDERSS